MNFLKAHGPAIFAATGAIVTFLLPSLQHVVSAEPKTAVGVLVSCILAAYYSQSPLSSK